MNHNKIGYLLIAAGLWLSVFVNPVSSEDGFTQSDRERLVRVEATLTTFMQQTDKRFEELRADMNARFEQVDKRFEELRADMNSRFEQVDKRFEQMTNIFYMLSGIFTTLFATVFGFAWWDRRSILITARKTAREEVEERTASLEDTTRTVNRLVEVLRSLAEKIPDLKELMRRANLL